MARDETKQQADPIPAPEFPYSRPVSLPDMPHGTHNGLGSIAPPTVSASGQAQGDARRTPTPARNGGIAMPGTNAMLGR